MDIMSTAQDLLNTAVATYAAIALVMLGMLALLCIGVTVVERRGSARERRRKRSRASGRTAAPMLSYGATRRRVLGAR